MSGPTGRLIRFAHPRLVLLAALGTVVGGIGLALFLTAGLVGHDLGAAGLRLAVLGGLVFAFGASGIVAFAVFEQKFD